jgi:hypothetical protein
MREIKFRGQDVKGNFVFGNLHVNENSLDSKKNLYYIIRPCFVPALTMPARNYIEVDPETIGQYLGIKDMAGNEVFEGDILKEESGSKTRISDGKKFPEYSSKTIEILFKDGNFKERVIAHENSYFGKIPSKPVDIKSWMITKAFKIIGNIHTPTNA